MDTTDLLRRTFSRVSEQVPTNPADEKRQINLLNKLTRRIECQVKLEGQSVTAQDPR